MVTLHSHRSIRHINRPHHRAVCRADEQFDILCLCGARYIDLRGQSQGLPLFLTKKVAPLWLHGADLKASALTVARSRFETIINNRTRTDGGLYVHSARLVIVYAQTI